MLERNAFENKAGWFVPDAYQIIKILLSKIFTVYLFYFSLLEVQQSYHEYSSRFWLLGGHKVWLEAATYAASLAQCPHVNT